ncbi:MAG: replication initiation protein [Capnocytophaga felis]|nr:replication initiation protein [Capnocytophaga felis]
MSNELVVIKANSLIEASYRLTINEIRILALTVGVMDPNSNQQVFDFSVADFVREFPEIQLKNAYKEIQIAIKKLYDRSVRTEDNERVTDFRWVSSKTYYKREGRFRIVLTNEVMPYLTQIKGQFTRYQLRNISAFNSVHAIRIYELCSQYRSVGSREISVDDLKKWLQVEDKYPRWDNFKSKVIEPAVTEINAKSDLHISVEPKKQGRKIIALDFTISAVRQGGEKTKKSAKSPTSKTRRIHSVFDETPRPQVAKGSEAEGKWATENLNRAHKTLKAQGLIKSAYLTEKDFAKLPTEWLKVLKKYCSIADKYTAREIADELHKRK